MSGASKGRNWPCLMAALYDFVSRMRQGRKNFSVSSWYHCLRRLAGVMTRIRRFRSAHFCDRTSPASMVLPRPTSSARSAPFERAATGTRRARHRSGADSDRPAHPPAPRSASRRCPAGSAGSARGRSTSRGSRSDCMTGSCPQEQRRSSNENRRSGHPWLPPDESGSSPPVVSGGPYGIELLIPEGKGRFKRKGPRPTAANLFMYVLPGASCADKEEEPPQRSWSPPPLRVRSPHGPERGALAPHGEACSASGPRSQGIPGGKSAAARSSRAWPALSATGRRGDGGRQAAGPRPRPPPPARNDEQTQGRPIALSGSVRNSSASWLRSAQPIAHPPLHRACRPGFIQTLLRTPCSCNIIIDVTGDM